MYIYTCFEASVHFHPFYLEKIYKNIFLQFAFLAPKLDWADLYLTIFT